MLVNRIPEWVRVLSSLAIGELDPASGACGGIDGGGAETRGAGPAADRGRARGSPEASGRASERWSRERLMHPLIEERRAELIEFCRRHRVKRLEIFGSGARGEDFDPARSDVDLLVEFEASGAPPSLSSFFELREALSVQIGRPVDLVEVGSVRNPYVLAEIERNRELVYAA